MTTFEELARSPDDAIDVALGAALVAKDVHESLDPKDVLAALDDLAAPLAYLGLERAPAPDQAEAVTARFRELGFHGNVEDYYDPKNSLLPDVLERRTGIPITLSIVWCELARRAGVHAAGVGFPGHFLARVDGADAHGAPPVIVDAFAGGRIVDEAGQGELLRRALGDGATMTPALLAPASPRAVLVRLLTNLKATWANRGEHMRAFVAIDRIVTLVPSSARMLRERAGVALKLGIVELARLDLARVIELEPHAPDVPQIRARLAELGKAVRIVN